MLQGVGIVLNVIGLALTSWGIVRESRQRRAPLIKPRERAAVARVRRALRVGPKPQIHQLTAAVEVSSAGHADAIVRKPRRPDDPIEQQLQAIEHNIAEEIAALRRQADRDREQHTERIGQLREKQSELAGQVAANAKAETEIASDALRVEFLGIALALLGTTLSAVG